MTSFFSSAIKSFKTYLGYELPTVRLIMLGLDAAGKTTYLYKIKPRFDEVVTTIPTIGFNVETLELQNFQITCWDVGGCDKIRPLWRHYIQGSMCFVFVVDSNDHERLESAKEELFMFFSEEEAKNCIVLVLANKQDLPRAKPWQEILKDLDLHKLKDRKWHIMETCMITGDGIDDSLRWLKAQFVDKKAAAKFPGMSSDEYFSNPENLELNETESKESKEYSLSSSSKTTAVQPTSEVDENVQEHERQKRLMIWDDWTTRVLPDDDEGFLHKLATYELDIWDHYTHVRIGWVLIMQHGLEQGFAKVEKGIQDFIANSGRTNGKSFHPTMTRFWCHMIAYWIYRVDAKTFPEYLKAVSEAKDVMTDVSEAGLFRKYYSGQVMFGTEARASAVRPDVVSLPSIALEDESSAGRMMQSYKHMEEDTPLLDTSSYYQRKSD